MIYIPRTAEQLNSLKQRYRTNKVDKPTAKPIKPHEIEKLSKKGLAFFLHKKADCIEDYRTLKRYSKSQLVSLALKLSYR